jgi:L-fucose isomerase-like protein
MAATMELDDREKLTQGLSGIENVDQEAANKSLKAYQALRKIIAENALDAVAVECWPEFMGGFGGAACFALGQLNDEGIDAACEADVIAALTMLVGRYFSGKTTFIADLVAGDDNSNELLFWHCGNGPRSLAASGCTPVCGVHPNRKVPLGLYFPLRGGDVTVARLSPDAANRMRLLSVAGTAVEAPLAFSGNSLPVQTKAPAEQIIDAILQKGFEHHYIVMYGDYSQELAEVADLLQLELIGF